MTLKTILSTLKVRQTGNQTLDLWKFSYLFGRQISKTLGSTFTLKTVPFYRQLWSTGHKQQLTVKYVADPASDLR